ncbi:kinesin-related protein 4-like isoform X2 [Chelonus insularis]|uniref:kinesin-related protein 4-like isoform X2 n=1 Tax=Chelonus insularis TaxID=460826 RepID=UPI00158BD267|nr:kinesin-related protein 4-like isoform X2 [Chelonus insularis]
MAMASIKVAVRVRPISTREIKITGPEVVVHTESKKISLINPKVPSSRTADSRKRIKQFYFDYCFDSSDPIANDYAGQEKIYNTLGAPVLDSFFSGYNASIVAYGQSASGKSYTMMGTENDPGIIPRICSDLFARASDEEKSGKVLRFFVSYLEIYNERVKDLLNTSMDAGNLRIREHPRFGPYVEVDLAGSEKSTACAGINRLKSQEGANINKSLVALGNVISALAERGSTSHVAGKRFIPYRDSTLTWLLKDSFGGNATTIMLATISPASGSYNETAHTLRFAQRAQSVVNKPVISEDPVSKIIRELQAEILRLKAQLLEKDTELTNDCKLLCSCRKNQDLVYTPRKGDDKNTPLLTYDNFNLSPTVIFRRHSFDDYLNSKLIVSNPLKKVGSLESISDLKNFNDRISYSRKYDKGAKSLKLVDNNSDESAFVDIPTLVAVLINADANAIEQDTHQIEELSTNSTHVDPIDERTNSFVINDSLTKKELPSESQDEKIEDKKTISSVPVITKKSKFKQSLSEVSKQSSTLNSQENIIKAPEECNNQGTKKASCLKDNGKEKVKNIVVKANNDRETKTTSSSQEAAIKKQSSENIERNISRGGGSNSSKDNCPLATEIIKNTRKNSTDPEQLLPRQHTVIQRARRAEIVAAVTERLYSSKKSSDDSNTTSTPASEIRSPEISEVKFPAVTRMRLREISRKMLAKRRRVCVDTQTDIYPTVRVKDAGISAEEPKIIYKDVSILTDRHEDFESLLPCSTPVIRLKEIATSTKDPAFLKPTILLKDVGSATEQCNNDIIPNCINNVKSEHSTNTCQVDEPKHSCIQTTHSDILIKNQPHPVNICELKHIPQNDVRYLSNQSLKCCPSISVCTDPSYYSKIIDSSHCCPKILKESCQCSSKNPEKNVISLSVPDTINIVIESSSILDSKLQIFDNEECQQKDENVQTENKMFSHVETLTDNVTKVNIRESWTNTRSVDEQTNTKPFKFQRLLNDLYKTSKSLRISTSDTIYDFDGPSTLSLEKRFNKTHIPSSNSYNKNNTTKKKEWLTKNRFSWMTYPNNDGLRHSFSSPRTKFNYLNVDNVIQSKLNIKTRNTLRHYSWRNIRRARSNSFDKKLRQWNRINFSNQIKNIRRKTPELLWTDNNLLYFKTFDNNYFSKKKSNVPDDNQNLKQVKTKCTAIKTDIMNGINKSEKRHEYLVDGTAHKNEQICSFKEHRGKTIDELKKKLENLTNEIVTTIHEFNPCLANVFLIPITFNGNETTKNCQNLLEKKNKNKIVIPIQPQQHFCSSSSTALEVHNQQISENGLTVQSCGDFTKSLQTLDAKVDPETQENPELINFLKLKNIPTNVKNDSSLNSSENVSPKNNNLIKDYLKETIIFMRNVNFMNELVNADVIKKKLLTKPRSACNKRIDQSTTNNHKVERKILDCFILENLLSLDENKFKKQLGEHAHKKSNTLNHKHLLNPKDNYYSRHIKINDENFSLELNNLTIKEFMNGRISNNYSKQRNILNKMKKRRHSEYCMENKNESSKLNDFVDDNELNSHIYLKITSNENDFVSKGRKLLSSPSRYTIPKYDSSTENSSSNEAFTNFIESIRYNYRYKNKCKISESPRLKLLQLLNERRQIIETSRELCSP